MKTIINYCIRCLALTLISPLALSSCVNDFVDGEHPMTFFYNDSLQNVINGGVKLADPFILLHNGTYYAYGTTSSNEGFKCYTSNDLKTWKFNPDFVLHKDNAFGIMAFWAPEVIYSRIHNKFIMYYSAERFPGVAISDSPIGSFISPDREPLITKCGIDGTVYVEDNNAYFYYSTDDVPEKIMAYELTDNFISLQKESETFCFTKSQSWEDHTIEGPYVVKFKNWYYMTYSTNSYGSADYGVGYAVAESPMGPWTKYNGNPILQYPEVGNSGIWGTGHSMIFTDKDGNMRIAFHGHGTMTFYDNRYLFIGDVVFEDNNDGSAPVMKIENIFCPQLIVE